MTSGPPRAGEPGTTPACRVSIIIKTLNEEKGIAATIESALRAVAGPGGEVVLADSCSTDRTVELAMQYPIRVVQLEKPQERCCGVGPQLGYQHSFGEYVYILDGDMQLQDGFLEDAIKLLEQREDVAGVGGRVIELNTDSLEYIAREKRGASHHRTGDVTSLDMGGLYRRTAIEAAGYFSDRNLHSYEEFDLAVRLRALNWKLWRLDRGSVTHFGHDAPPYVLLMRRWKSRYLCGLGELIRAAVGQPRLRMVLTGVKELRLYIAVLGWWAVLLAMFFLPIPVLAKASGFLLVLLVPVVVMIWRKRSFEKGLYAIVSWSFNTAGLLRGLLQKPRPPNATILSRVLREPTEMTAFTANVTSH